MATPPTIRPQTPMLAFPAAPVGEAAAAAEPVPEGVAPVADDASPELVPLALVNWPLYWVDVTPEPFLHSAPVGTDEVKVMSAHCITC